MALFPFWTFSQTALLAQASWHSQKVCNSFSPGNSQHRVGNKIELKYKWVLISPVSEQNVKKVPMSRFCSQCCAVCLRLRWACGFIFFNVQISLINMQKDGWYYSPKPKFSDVYFVRKISVWCSHWYGQFLSTLAQIADNKWRGGTNVTFLV